MGFRVTVDEPCKSLSSKSNVKSCNTEQVIACDTGLIKGTTKGTIGTIGSTTQFSSIQLNSRDDWVQGTIGDCLAQVNPTKGTIVHKGRLLCSIQLNSMKGRFGL